MLENAAPDPRDDIYALACIAHELLTGRHPFDRMVANDARDSGMKLVRRASLSAAQFRAIAHGLEFDREKRTPSVEKFMEEFTAGTGISRSQWQPSWARRCWRCCVGLYVLGRRQIDHWLAVNRGTAIPIPAQGEVFRDCPTCPLMKALPPGQFEQGAAAGQADASPLELPRHPVNIAYPLGMGVYEITVGEFREFAAGHQPQERGLPDV